MRRRPTRGTVKEEEEAGTSHTKRIKMSTRGGE
jgi:hypothetical protein